MEDETQHSYHFYKKEFKKKSIVGFKATSIKSPLLRIR